jgi:hypothetical protein
MKTREFFITMRDGQVVNRECLKKQIVSLPDGRFVFKIEDKRKRSLPQNAYYWACVVPMVKDALYDAGWEKITSDLKAHNFMKELFLKEEVINVKTGEVIPIEGSTADQTKETFSIYLEKIYQWAAEYLGLVIPNPGEPIEIFSP